MDQSETAPGAPEAGMEGPGRMGAYFGQVAKPGQPALITEVCGQGAQSPSHIKNKGLSISFH